MARQWNDHARLNVAALITAVVLFATLFVATFVAKTGATPAPAPTSQVTCNADGVCLIPPMVIHR